jgi:hypothetical protein
MADVRTTKKAARMGMEVEGGVATGTACAPKQAHATKKGQHGAATAAARAPTQPACAPKQGQHGAATQATRVAKGKLHGAATGAA